MSENLDLVRSIYADWERGDYRSAEWADADIEFVIADGTDPGSWTGIAGMTGAWREVLSVWDDLRVEVDDYRPLDGERVLALPTWTGRARTSGLDLTEMPWTGASLFHIRDGKVVKLILYWDSDRALADLGLEEQAVAEKSTTPDLVERSQRLVDAMNAGDIDAAMNLYASDVVVEGAMQTLEGRGAVRGWTRDWRDAFDEFELTAEEVRDLGNSVTFGVSISRGRPRGGAGWIQFRYGVVNTWVDGLVRRSTFYLDIDEARAAAERLAQERG